VIRLTTDNSMSRVEGLSVQQFKELRELLSYRVDQQTAFFSGGHRPQVRHLMDKRGAFPTGLLYIVEDYLKGKEVLRSELRKRPKPSPGLFKLTLAHIPYLEQTGAAVACQTHHRGIVVAPTGVGKSVIAALIISRLQVRTLIVVPSLELKRQLTESLQAAFPGTRVGTLASSANIAIENVDALDAGKPLKGYDCVIIDEFHHSGAKTYRQLNQKAWNGVYYRFGLTATPFRSNEDERLLLESVLSQVIYRVEYKTAVEAGYIVPLEAYYYDLPLTEVKGNDMSWPTVYSELVVSNAKRNLLIGHLMHRLHEVGASTLCLVKEIAHGNRLKDITGAGFANGQDEDCRQLISWFSSGKLKALVGTTGVLGEGVDTKPAEWIVIAGLGKSKNAFMQQVGRGFRRYDGKESCKVVLFRDPSHKWTLAHFAAQVKYLREEYGVKPVRLDLPDNFTP
jgi:superfamily II DNA or RNA helicase